MPQNKAYAPLLAKGFPIVLSTWLGDPRTRRSHRNKQNKTKYPNLKYGYYRFSKIISLSLFKHFEEKLIIICLSNFNYTKKLIIIWKPLSAKKIIYKYSKIYIFHWNPKFEDFVSHSTIVDIYLPKISTFLYILCTLKLEGLKKHTD